MIKKKKNGFTLVELVVTIAIMLAIVGIAVPSAINMTNKSKQKSHDLQVKEFETAAETLVLDNKNKWNVESIADSEYCISLKDLLKNKLIKEIPEDAVTGEKYNGSVIVKNGIVDDVEMLTYKYTDSSCSDEKNLVLSNLIELQNYDDYLKLSKSDNSIVNIKGNIVNTLSDFNVSSNYRIGENNIEPGINCVNDYCSFVGGTENNYVKIEGLKYDNNIDYSNQADKDMLWRIVSFDKNNNTTKLISDSGVAKASYGLSNDVGQKGAIEYSKLKDRSIGSFTKQYIGSYNNEDDVINKMSDLLKDYYTYRKMEWIRYTSSDDNELDLLLNNCEMIKHFSFVDGWIYDYDKIISTNISQFNNVPSKGYVVYYLPAKKTGYYGDSNSTYNYKVDYFLSIKNVNDTYYINKIVYNEPQPNNKSNSDIYQRLNSWYSSNATKLNNIIKSSKYCHSSYNGTDVSNNKYGYTDLNVSVDSIKNCNYMTSFGINESMENTYVGLLSIAEFINMGGYVKDSGSHGFDNDYDDAQFLYINNTMFKYNSSKFATGDFESIYRSDGIYDAKMFVISYWGYGSLISDELSIRPVITIDGSKSFISGTGTKTDPYILKNE